MQPPDSSVTKSVQEKERRGYRRILTISTALAVVRDNTPFFLLLRLVGNLWLQQPHYWSRTCRGDLHPLPREGVLGLKVYRLKTSKSQMVGKTRASAGQITSPLQVRLLRVDSRPTLLGWYSPWKG